MTSRPCSDGCEKNKLEPPIFFHGPRLRPPEDEEARRPDHLASDGESHVPPKRIPPRPSLSMRDHGVVVNRPPLRPDGSINHRKRRLDSPSRKEGDPGEDKENSASRRRTPSAKLRWEDERVTWF